MSGRQQRVMVQPIVSVRTSEVQEKLLTPLYSECYLQKSTNRAFYCSLRKDISLMIHGHRKRESLSGCMIMPR